MIRNINWNVFALLLLCIPLMSQAGQVRNVYTNDKIIKPINLSMGQSTILRFKEKPKKIVVGNANYIHIEFIDNDLAIQPLKPITTNLFVYAEFGRTYGFTLKVRSSQYYDDLVNVRWKTRGRIKFNKPRKKKPSKKKLKKELKLGKVLLISVESVTKHDALNLHFVDLTIKNISNSKLNIKPIKIKLTRTGMPLPQQQLVIDSEALKKDEDTKARVILRLKEQKSFSLRVRFQNKTAKTIISRNRL